MAVLDTGVGWVQGDQVRVLIAAGLNVGSYNIEQITLDMNQLGEYSTEAVTKVRTLLDEYEAAQVRYQTLNSEGDNRILTKADVLEWEQNNGFRYDPITEFNRIKTLLYQYFGFSVLFVSSVNQTPLYRSWS